MHNSALEHAYQDQIGNIGSEVGLSSWVCIDQTMANAFADVTQDPQFIHTDPDRAAGETPFGGTIAHGFLSLSMASKFEIECFSRYPGQTMGINYGLNKVRFLTPVRTGSRIRGRFTLVNVERRGSTGLLRTLALTVEIEDHSTPALVAEWLGLAVFDPQDEQ